MPSVHKHEANRVRIHSIFVGSDDYNDDKFNSIIFNDDNDDDNNGDDGDNNIMIINNHNNNYEE